MQRGEGFGWKGVVAIVSRRGGGYGAQDIVQGTVIEPVRSRRRSHAEGAMSWKVTRHAKPLHSSTAQADHAHSHPAELATARPQRVAQKLDTIHK